LHPEQAPRSGGVADPEPQLQFQFQTQSDEDAAGVTELTPKESSEQFQLQFQVQLNGVSVPRSGSVTDVTDEAPGEIPVLELVLPIFPV
jgi:hypothetical protein